MVRAPRITGDRWFNSTQIQPNDLKGKVLLVDFWTYSCINCKRTLPYLKDWWGKYKDKGLMIIGVHTPEFDFEKDSNNVQKAIDELSVQWPVVQDNEYKNWNQFANKYWPAKYLVNQEGFIVYSHFGEGAYAETESKIQELIGELESARELPQINLEEHEHGKVCFPATPELYVGYGRSHIDGSDFSNGEGYKEDEVYKYRTPRKMREDSYGLEGEFLVTKEFAHTNSQGTKLLLNFKATEVNVVMDSEKQNSKMQVKLNGEFLTEKNKGYDVNEDSVLTIAGSKLYNVLKSKKRTEGLLEIELLEGDFKAYSFTFSGCEE